MREGDRVRLRLESMVYGPEAVGRVDGQAVFALGGAPGDEAVVRLARRQGRLWRGEVVEVVEPSPARREAPCPYFGPCGGCQWQHLTDAEQLAQKARVLVDTLARLGRIEVEAREPVGMSDPWRYRNASQFHIAPDGTTGYRVMRSYNVVDVAECPISQDGVNAVLAAIRADPPELELRLEARAGLDGALLSVWGDRPPRTFVRRLRREGAVVGVVLLPRVPQRRTRGPVEIDQEDVEPASAEYLVLNGRSYVEMPLLGRRFRVTGGAFFQVNTKPDPRLLPAPLEGLLARYWPEGIGRPLSQADALALAAFDALDPQAGTTVVDAYAGVGAFAVILSGVAGQVIAIEQSPIAAADARYNADFGQGNLRIVQASVEEGLAVIGDNRRVDAVLLDPPRAGCGPSVIRELRRLGPRRIAYVSCDPSTLARDLAALTAAGENGEATYRPLWTQVIDLFPQTYHVESVTCLERAS